MTQSPTSNVEIVVKMKKFLKQNFIYICLAIGCLSLLLYLIAFSIELSRILDTKRSMNNEASSVLLCVIYFALFLSATILINGLATQMSMGLLIWSLIISVLTIPELIIIMMQFWASESDHGLTDVIFYFTRLVFNCIILVHVVPLALKWRKEKKILKQLESLASRLQLTAVTPAPNYGNYNGNTLAKSTKGIENGAVCGDESKSHDCGNGEKIVGGIDNHGYFQSYPYIQHYGSQNEFDASIFGLNPSQYIGPPIQATAKRTQSLLDLRFVQTTTRIVQRSKDKSDSVSLNSYDMRLQKNLAKDSKTKASAMRSGSKEHIYHTMESPHKKSLGRNCVSLENLGVFVTEDAFAGGNSGPFPPSYPQIQAMYPACFYYNNPFPSLHHQPQQPHPFYMGYNSYLAHQNSAYFNSSSLGNSKQSLDDYRKYRDVAL